MGRMNPVWYFLFLYTPETPKLVTRRTVDWPGAQNMKQGPCQCSVLCDRYAVLLNQPLSGMFPDPRHSIPPWPGQGMNDHSKKAKIPENQSVQKDLRKIS